MKKILTSKVAVVVMILLVLMGALMRPSRACRVLHGGARATKEDRGPIVLQTLQKGRTPCTGNCRGYTPRSSTTAGTTSTRAFAGPSAVGVPPHDNSDRVPRSGVAANRK
ncbi:hypothetical protein ACJRO7_030783 [Eucalyptus globulus]|uniref:Secreted protein n=1 Tax=Eucalyptus globulus TaxID=34317 RepID=A0ABD3JCQ7_EUCGL